MAAPRPKPTIEQVRRSLAAGDLATAETVCRKLLRRSKRDVDVLKTLGGIAVMRLDLDQALRLYKQCLSIRPRDAEFYFLVGKVQAMQNRFDQAIPRFDRALELHPGYVSASEWKAMILEWGGGFDEARAALAPFIAAGDETDIMAEVQAKLQVRDKRYREAIDVLTRHLHGDRPPDIRHRLGHLAGTAWEKLGDYDAAFEAHTRANQSVARSFDPDEYVRSVDRLVDAFSRDNLAKLPRAALRTGIPVFIAGLPRSGTTLVEQILDAHPRGHGAGEIADIPNTARALQSELDSSLPYPDCVADFTIQAADRLAKRYVDGLKAIAPSAARVVNKSLENYRMLGLIALLFPDTAVIHCRRDPRDTCLSCYTSNILPERFPWVTDLRHLGLVYRQYERLMAHWQSVLDTPMLEVRYEELVDDLEGHARRIIDFCGLQWNEACLRFHASGRVVTTLSYDQVRQPVYRSSVGRYKGYERHLAPLREALG